MIKFHHIPKRAPDSILHMTAFQILTITTSLFHTIIVISANPFSLPTSTPNFGACIDLTSTPTNGRLTCTTTPSSCLPPNHLYKLPSQLEVTLCHSPHHVEIGRCTSNADLDSCSFAQSSCLAPEEFVEGVDTECSLVEDLDSNYDRLTHYPHCQTRSSIDINTPRRCVMSAEECITGREDFVTVADLPKSPCYCADVPTGMCTSVYTSPPAVDTSFCAISEVDCPAGYDFMPAYELTNMGGNAPLICRLCEDADYGNYELHETVVESGGCYSTQGQYIVRCVLESTDCSAELGEVFYSSAQVRAVGGVTCPAEIFSGGKCTSGLDEVDCTNKAGSCNLPVKFIPDESCSLHSDLATGEVTYFPRCREVWATGGDWRQYRCVWDESECDIGPEDFDRVEKPVSWFEGCNCEHVVTGACRESNGEYYCAVSKDGCSGTDAYINSRETGDVGLDCRLCQPKRVLEVPTRFPTTEGHGDIIANHNDNVPPTTAPIGGSVDDDDDYVNDYVAPPSPDPKVGDDDDYVKPGVPIHPEKLTFAPTASALKGAYDDFEDYDDDRYTLKKKSKFEFPIELLLVGGIGGSFLLSTIATYAYYRQAKATITATTEGDLV